MTLPPTLLEDLSDLVTRAQGGDPAAFEDLVKRTQRQLFFTVLRVVQDRYLADDIVQEVYIKAYQCLGELKSPGVFKGWLHRIAMNRAIDAKRSAKKTADASYLVEDWTMVGKEDPERGPEPAEVARLELAVNEAISDLPAAQRAVLSMTMDKGMSQEDIAVVLECPVGTIKSRLHHARKTLKEKLRRFLNL